jgi:hypothetical protein
MGCHVQRSGQLFAKLDTNKDGKLSQSELVKVRMDVCPSLLFHPRHICSYIHDISSCGLNNRCSWS